MRPPLLPPRHHRSTDDSVLGINGSSSLEDRGSAAVRLDFRTRRNIQRNILPDLVCDSVLSGFRRYNGSVRENPVEIPNQNEIVDEIEPPSEVSASSEQNIIKSEPKMGQRISHPQKPNISFAWVLRGDSNSSSSSTTSSASNCSSSFYQNSSVSRQFTSWHDKRRQQCKSRKHHLFNEKNLKGSDLDDYRITRKTLFETTTSKCNNNNSPTLDIDRLSLSTAETTTSISKCVDKATNLKKKRYRSKTRINNEGNCVNNNNNNESNVKESHLNERINGSKDTCSHKKRWESTTKGISSVTMPNMDGDTSEFDDYLKKVR